jgi:cytochrome c oxidase accessory protein FixG
VTVCPTHIDIRKGLQLECINCLECVDACTTVMGKLGKPSLVQWSSTNTIVENKPTKVFRKTTIMYMVALTLVLVLLFAMSREKEYMLLNVNKDTELYKIKEDNIVANNYTLLFQNTESVPLTYNIEIVDNPGIEIKRFTPFTLSPKKMAKKVLILETDKLLVDDKTKDTPISITIKAYAQENPEKVVVFRKATFFFPRSDKLK